MTLKNKTKTTKWDSAEFLTDDTRIAAYLAAAFEEAGDDSAFIAKALGTVARARGMTDLAKKTGMSRAALYKALSGEGNPEFGTILKVAGAMGYKLVPAPLTA